MEDINTIIHRKKERLKKLNDFNYITTMNDAKRNNEIYRLKGYIEALNDVKNKKIYTQERDILERIYEIVSKHDKETLKAIERYCDENNIIPNIIEKEKLDLVLKLGITEYNRRIRLEIERTDR